MSPSARELFASIITRVNTAERREREDYFAYLEKRGDHSETLDEHMAKYASFARFGVPASQDSIDRLRRLSGPALPQPLIDFYLDMGSLHGGNRLQGLVIYSADELIAHSHADTPRWQHLRSIGLVDMIVRSFGGDRFEFDPASGEGLTQQEVDALNRQFSVIGWHTTDDGEGFEYIYFDRDGKFGTVGYHQDDFEAFYERELKRMMLQSDGYMTLDQALHAMLRSAACG